MDDELEDPDWTETAIFGGIAWLLIPFVVGRLADANLSTSLGNWARPCVILVLLAWAAYRPADSRLKIALLAAVDLLLLVGLGVSSVAFVVAIVVADFDLRAVYGLAWLAPCIAAALGAVRLALRRWIRRDFRRRRKVEIHDFNLHH